MPDHRRDRPIRTTAPPEPDAADEAGASGQTRRSLIGHALAVSMPQASVSPARPTTPTHQLRTGATSPAGYDPDPDAELLRQCRIVQALEAEDALGSDDRWTQALMRVGAMRPATLGGLQAKTRLALALLPFDAAPVCPAWASPDERLLWSLLHDILALARHDTDADDAGEEPDHG